MTLLTLDTAAEVEAITADLIARRDPDYESGMRRTVPSAQPAHSVRVPEIRKTASKWQANHRGLPAHDVLAVCDALWATRYREERIVAIALVCGTRGVMDTVQLSHLVGWSADIDNWEHVDHLADVTGRLLIADPALLDDVKTLRNSDNPWQRRLALVTLIVAFMKGDGSLRDEMIAMADSLAKDPHPLVRRAVVWARDRLKKDHLFARQAGSHASQWGAGASLLRPSQAGSHAL